MSTIGGAFSQIFSADKQRVECIWVGLSAGIDSTVLLHGLAQYLYAHKSDGVCLEIKAIHVHHGLSKYADDWAQQAQRLCEQLSQQFQLNIECIIEKVQLSIGREGLEYAAREARYHIFEKYCGPNDVLFQGHHLDDQIETFFMRALRGSGLKGLTGIPAQRDLSREKPCKIIRPFLEIEKSQLIHHAKEHQLTWVEDESNQDTKIERNWWRNHLLPQIWQYYGNKKHVISRSMNNLRQEQALLDHFMKQAMSLEVKGDEYAFVDEKHLNSRLSSQTDNDFSDTLVRDVLNRFPSILMEKIPSNFAASYLRAWLSQYVDILPAAGQMQRICDDFLYSSQDANPHFCWAKVELRRYRERIFLISEFPNDSGLFVINAEKKCIDTNNPGCIEYKIKLLAGCYQWRQAQSGDQIKVSGRPNRKLKKYWQELGVPPWLREQWPVLVDEERNQLVCVLGLLIAEDYKYREGCSSSYYSWHINSPIVCNGLTQ